MGAKPESRHHLGARIAGRRDPGITIAALRAFVTVVETGGFSAAAAALGLSQPSVSAQVQNLEESCGVRLLHRRGRFALTEDGRNLLVRARLVLSRVDEFEHVVHDIRALRRGRLNLGFSTPNTTMAVLARYLDENPGVAISASAGNSETLLADVVECRVDVAMMTLDAPPSGFAFSYVTPTRMGLCVRHDDPWAKRRVVPFSDLAGAAIILREAGSMTRALFETGCREAGVTTDVRLVVPNREALREAVSAGLGRGILLDTEIGQDTRLGFARLGNPQCEGGIYAVALREMAEVPAIAAFLALAAQPAVGRKQRAT